MPYNDDKRISCKYGASCYQKNPLHLAKYKHPYKRNRLSDSGDENLLKKQKVNLQNDLKTEIEPERENAFTENCNDDIANNDISDSALAQVVDQVESVIPLRQNVFETFKDRKKFITKKFLVEMPDDFYHFWDFCVKFSKKPTEALKQVGLLLVGPFNILDESFQVGNETDEELLLHWRYYYDPPEFQTIIKGNDATGFHLGYFRDSPEETPAFVGCNESIKNCIIEPYGGNIFGALNTYLENQLKTADPFKKISISKLHKSLVLYAKELNINLKKITPSMQERDRKIVCKTFHQAGIVVPYDRKTLVGYRELPVNEAGLKIILNKITKNFDISKDKAFNSLHPVLTAAAIANDECDFGAGLELGINLFCYGSDCLNNTALNLLKTSYSLLERDAFATIAEAHLKNRKKGMPFVLKQLQQLV